MYIKIKTHKSRLDYFGMGKRRDTFEVYKDVLKSCEGGEKKTRISFKANVELTRLNPILKRLVNASLLEVKEEGTVYRITEKGKTFLRILEDL